MNLMLQSAAVASRRLCLLLICVLASVGLAQSVQAPRGVQPPHTTIALDPPTGWELQAHTFDSKGTRLPEAPATFRRLGEARVGELSEVHTLTLRFAENTRLTTISASKDFRVEKGGSCEAGNAYEKGTSCTVLVRFTPQGAGNRLGHLMVGTDISASPMAFGLGGFGYSPVLSFVPAVISTVPGTYPSNVGLLNGAHNLAVDGGDTLWIADTGDNAVMNLDSSGTFKTLTSGSTYTAPWGIAVDTFGQAYFSRPAANIMNEIYDYGPIVQINGSGTTGCPASTPCNLNSEGLGTPSEMSMDGYNHLFFVDSHSGTAMATVQPLPAKLIFLYNPFPFQTNPPSAMAADTSDNLYSMWSNGSVCELVQASLYNAENSNVSFVKIAGGHTCGFSGDGGIAGNAEIGAGVGQITFDTAGDLYFSDTSNQRVRRIDYTTGIIRTIAGNGTAGYTGDSAGGPGAELSAPTGVGVNSQGAVYIISSAATGQVIRKLGPNGIVNFGNQGKGTTSAAHQSTVTNTGNSAMVLSTYSFSGPNASEFKINPPTTTCGLTNGSQLFSGQTCQIGVIFTPTAAGTRTANLVLAGNTITGFNTIQLIGNGVKPSPTFTITSPAGGSSVKSGTAVTFSVKVTSTLTPAPTGTVQFKVDGANFGGPVTLAGGVASTSVTGLTQTSHTLSAVYNGDANYAPAGPISVSITVTAVKVGSFVSLSPTVNAAGSCAAPGFTVSVTGKSGPAPLGEVQLLDGSKVLGTASLANGKATLSTHGLSAGPHTLTARYAGDDLHLGSVSSTLTENVRPTKPCTGPVSGNGARTVAF